MSTLAQHWQDFQAHCYRGRSISDQAARELRMLFYTGFASCISELARMDSDQLPEDKQVARVRAYMEEFKAFAERYVSERNQEKAQ